jgi:hypothetical protein
MFGFGLNMGIAKRGSAAPPAPVNTVLPAISGPPTVGQTINGSDGTWTNSPTSYAYQWFADGVAISGATANSYLLTTAEFNKFITFRVTATNAGGSTAATSAAVGQVAAAAAATFVSDDLNNATGSAVDVNGWVPDIGNAWVEAAHGSATGVVAASGGAYVTGSVSSNHFTISPTAPASADYEVRAGVREPSNPTRGLPGLLTHWDHLSPAQLGYRVYINSDNTINFLRFNNSGTAVVMRTVPIANPGTVVHNDRLAVFVLPDRVRLRWVNELTGAVVTYDDTHADRITNANYGGINYRLNSRIQATVTIKALPQATAHSAIVADGVRSRFVSPPSFVDGSFLFAGSVKADGSVQVTKTDGTTHTTTVLDAALDIDDHAEPGLLKLPGGKMFAAWSRHGLDSTVFYKISSNALPDISAFSARRSITDAAGNLRFFAVCMLSDNIVRVFYRQGNSGTRPTKMASAPAADIEAGTETWTLTTLFQETNQRPYPIFVKNGSNRIDVLINTGHTNETAATLYHAYLQPDAGTLKCYTSAGVEIPLPCDVSTEATLIDNATGGRCLPDKIAIGADGQPRVIWFKYPTAALDTAEILTNIEYWHGRWDGSAWVKNRIKQNQRSLYRLTGSSMGGNCSFDGNDTTILYISEIVNDIYEIRKYQINEGTGALTLLSIVTANSQVHCIRPHSPAGGSRPFALTYCHANRYTALDDFSTELRAA